MAMGYVTLKGLGSKTAQMHHVLNVRYGTLLFCLPNLLQEFFSSA